MIKLIRNPACLLFMVSFTVSGYSQHCGNLNIRWQADIPSTCNYMVMTMLHDQLGRSFLYVANKEAGLKVYDISTLSAPTPVAGAPTNLYDTLDVMSLTQDGNYLYLAVGNHFINPQQGGMAVVDVTDPAAPVVTDYYVVPSSASGAGIVRVEGNYAYLGAMKSGLVIFDVTDKSNIIFVSQFIPDINFPVANPNPDLYNARGMDVKNSIVYLCYDAGGLRIINCQNKSAPVETGRYVNPVMYTPFNRPRAYNNIVLDDSLAYIAVDYCGLEVLDISDTGNITLTGWWNPYGCPNNNWFTSRSHANEMHYDENCKLLFLSTGKSDMMVVDVSDPAQPDSCNFYGGTSNNIGTWGISAYQNEIYLSYICAVVPFSSNWTGVKILTYTECSGTKTEEVAAGRFILSPNPATREVKIQAPHDFNCSRLALFSPQGQRIETGSVIEDDSITISTHGFSTGLYFVLLQNASKQQLLKFVVNKTE